MKLFLRVLSGLLWLVAAGCAHSPATITDSAVTGQYAGGDRKTPSWSDRRNEQVIRQQLDYSCGAASLATLLTYYYRQPVSEEALIAALGKSGMLSFADLQEVLPTYGFKGVGLALDYEQLQKLKIPAVLYIENRDGPHFVVLRGITDKTVWVADPARGNNKYPVERFREKWEVRKDQRLKGKILLVIPQDKEKYQKVANEFFYPYPSP